MFPQPVDLRALVVAKFADTVLVNDEGLLVTIGVDVGDPLLKPRFAFEQRFDAIPLLVIGLPSRFFDQLFQDRVLPTFVVVHDSPVQLVASLYSKLVPVVIHRADATTTRRQTRRLCERVREVGEQLKFSAQACDSFINTDVCPHLLVR